MHVSGFLKLLLFMISVCVCVCVCVCVVCLPPRQLISSCVIWTLYDWLNYGSQPNKSKLAPYKLSIHFNSHLKQLYITNKT